MPIQRNKPNNDPEIKVIRACWQCNGNAEIPQPVPNFKPGRQPDGTWGAFSPDRNGRMLCWDCYDKQNGHWVDRKIDEMIAKRQGGV